MNKATYEEELKRLQAELVKLQYWQQRTGERIVVVFEGRDASGKGGMIKAFHERLNPRQARIAALPTPTERERTQWYFQRYVAHLPAAGELVLFDRSWYNRAVVERVMGFANEAQVSEFFRSCPAFEEMLIRSGIRLVKYWLSVSDAEQEDRFQQRAHDPMKRWKLSPIDLEALLRYVEFSRAKDEMLAATDTQRSPWFVVPADSKKSARLNCLHHFLSLVPYTDVVPPEVELGPRPDPGGYVRPPYEDQNVVPQVF